MWFMILFEELHKIRRGNVQNPVIKTPKNVNLIRWTLRRFFCSCFFSKKLIVVLLLSPDVVNLLSVFF